MQWLKAASEDFLQIALMNLGNLDLNNEQFKELEVVCTFFSKKKVSADELKYILISQNIGFNLMKVICTSYALQLHLLRATHQLIIVHLVTKNSTVTYVHDK